MSALMERGGPIMWPLLAVSFATLTIVLERLFFWLREMRVSSVDALQAACKRAGVAGRRAAEVERLLDREEARLARGLGWLDTAVTAAPMLGILGTVLGIIDSFELLSAEGAVDPLAISGGVAQALVTTAAGLSIALLALLPFNALRGAVARRISQLERDWRIVGDGHGHGDGA